MCACTHACMHVCTGVGTHEVVCVWYQRVALWSRLSPTFTWVLKTKLRLLACQASLFILRQHCFKSSYSPLLPHKLTDKIFWGNASFNPVSPGSLLTGMVGKLCPWAEPLCHSPGWEWSEPAHPAAGVTWQAGGWTCLEITQGLVAYPGATR